MPLKRLLFEGPHPPLAAWFPAVGCKVIAASVLVPPFFLGPLRTAVVYFGITLLHGVVPKFKKIESKDRSRVLKSWFFDFRFVPFAVCPLALSFLHNCTGVWYFVIWLVTCFFGGLVWFALWVWGIWSFRFIRVRDVTLRKNLWRFLLASGAEESRFEAMWLEDNQTLLAAFPEEHSWLILRWNTDSQPRRSRINVTLVRDLTLLFGKCPPFRLVRFRDDHEWLEDLWSRYEIDPWICGRVFEGFDAVEDYETQVRWFFHSVFDHCGPLTFPNPRAEMHARDRSRALGESTNILNTVPESSIFYQVLREEALARLHDLEPLDEEEEALKSKDPDEYSLSEESIRKWMTAK